MANSKEVLKLQLFNVIRSMEQEGTVDFRFRMVYTLKEVNGPLFFAELLTTFCSDSQITIREMTQVLEQPTMDFYAMQELCMKIKGGSSCIGACLVANACGALRHAVDAEDKGRCIGAVEAIKMEFLRVREKMEIIAQLERSLATVD